MLATGAAICFIATLLLGLGRDCNTREVPNPAATVSVESASEARARVLDACWQGEDCSAEADAAASKARRTESAARREADSQPRTVRREECTGGSPVLAFLTKMLGIGLLIASIMSGVAHLFTRPRRVPAPMPQAPVAMAPPPPAPGPKPGWAPTGGWDEDLGDIFNDGDGGRPGAW
jgi:hypothetical protein